MIKKIGIFTLLLTIMGCSSVETNNCCSTSYTVEEPVKVIYKKTTVHRVYVPKTYTETTYEERPYCYQNLCK